MEFYYNENSYHYNFPEELEPLISKLRELLDALGNV